MPVPKLYVFTIPKSGTYFLAELLSRLGWRNSHMHIAEAHYLDNKDVDVKAIARDPLLTLNKAPFNDSLGMVENGALCYGHMNPMHFYGPHRSDFAVVGCRRHLREVLVAEFIDFRFRREDHLVQWISREAVADDFDAFAAYMERHGPIIAHIAATYIAYRDLRAQGYYNRAAKLAPYVDLSFEGLMGPYPLVELRKLARGMSLPHGDDELLDVLEQAKNAENKTKSVGETIAVDRAALWDAPGVAQAYDALGLPELAARLGYPQ